eukprot:scaffold251352_cov13-Tisochrysis_lutea.AAC.1
MLVKPFSWGPLAHALPFSAAACLPAAARKQASLPKANGSLLISCCSQSCSVSLRSSQRSVSLRSFQRGNVPFIAARPSLPLDPL